MLGRRRFLAAGLKMTAVSLLAPSLLGAEPGQPLDSGSSYARPPKDKPGSFVFFTKDISANGLLEIAKVWNTQPRKRHVSEAIEILKEKFGELDAYGPSQVIEFYNSTDTEERSRQQRRAFELVQDFLTMLR